MDRSKAACGRSWKGPRVPGLSELERGAGAVRREAVPAGFWMGMSGGQGVF